MAPVPAVDRDSLCSCREQVRRHPRYRELHWYVASLSGRHQEGRFPKRPSEQDKIRINRLFALPEFRYPSQPPSCQPVGSNYYKILESVCQCSGPILCSCQVSLCSATSLLAAFLVSDGSAILRWSPSAAARRTARRTVLRRLLLRELSNSSQGLTSITGQLSCPKRTWRPSHCRWTCHAAASGRSCCRSATYQEPISARARTTAPATCLSQPSLASMSR
jgi:hypothetical protein